MKTILNSAEFIHIPEYSVYCYNFYRNRAVLLINELGLKKEDLYK